VTVAPFTTAPLASVTVPEIVPVDVDCAATGGTVLNHRTAEQKMRTADREEKIC
jgi:hypothetical protein